MVFTAVRFYIYIYVYFMFYSLDTAEETRVIVFKNVNQSTKVIGYVLTLLLLPVINTPHLSAAVNVWMEYERGTVCGELAVTSGTLGWHRYN